ncbi:MAG: hypothetical protein HFH69_06680 [Lachnospiraceae bacterium]|nr:hypothetical protein [Lachnospiraceae bacterium]
MVIAHNLEANFTGRQLGVTNKALAKNTEKLSTSYRINHAADDASGLAVSEGMRGQIRGLDRGALNTQEGQGFCQVADGAMQELEEIVQRIRELSVQSANDTNTEQDRIMIQYEVDQLIEEVDRITNDTEYNTIKVFTDKTANVQGKHYGLSKVLGKDHVYQADKMDNPVTFLNAGWNNTGKEADAPGGSYAVSRTNLLNNIANDTGNSITIPVNPPTSGATSTTVVSGNYTANVEYEYLKQDGTRLLSKVTLADNSVQPPTSKVYSVSTGASGTKGIGYSTQYYSAWIDFEGLGKNYQLSDLYGQGFNTGCTHCGGYSRYNVLFTGKACDKTNADGVNYTFKSETTATNNIHTLTINLSGCKTSEEIVGRIMSAANSEPGFTNHFIQLANNSAEPSKIHLYDDVPNSKTSEFEPAVRNKNGLVLESGRSLGIQVGGNSNQVVVIDQPYMSAARLGLSMLNLTTRENANHSISVCDYALDILNSERAYMGTMVNRFDHAYNNDLNSSENLQVSESLIRDLDMADEMVKHAANSIMQQSIQSLFSQANSSKESVRALFQ